MQITLAKTIEVPQAWMAKDEAVVYFGYQQHKSLFKKVTQRIQGTQSF